MGYKPKQGGYTQNARIARGKSAAKEQRTIIEQIIRRGPTRADLYQLSMVTELLYLRTIPQSDCARTGA